MKSIMLCSSLCVIASGAIFAQSVENPFVYSNANDQLQSCQGIASQNASYCTTVSDFNDRQICAGLATHSQDPCRTMTDRNLQLTCYGMAFAPNFPSNCRDITIPGLQDFCYSVSSWGSWANCSKVSNAEDRALCLALTYRSSSYCATITNINDRQFCYGVSTHDSSYCGSIPPSTSAGGPYTVNEGGSVAVTASGAGSGASYAWDLDNDGSFETPGQSATFSAAALDGPDSRQISVQATVTGGQTATAQTTVNIVNVAPTATFNAPGMVNQGSMLNLSLTTPVDVDADRLTLEYAFDCGNGYGPSSAVNTASCPTPSSNTAIVRGRVRDKDGGANDYTATVTISTPTVRPNPYSVQAPNDSTFVVDHAPDLDTGCSTLGDRSLKISIPVDRVVGTFDDTRKLVANKLLAQTALLKMPAYDINFSGGNGFNPERDRVYFNGHLVPTEFLTGSSGTWKLNVFSIPTEWVKFPVDPIAKNLTALTPEMNILQIDIDTGNTKTFSCTSLDWASLSIAAARPVLLVHGILSDHETWDKLWVPTLRKVVGLPVDTMDVGKLGSIQGNSAKIREKVNHLRLLWGVDRINIGAHSKGGLDSRDYIEGHDTVATLAQIGTPNGGSPLASLVQRGLVSIFGIIGTGIIDLLAPAAYQLTPEYMSLYNSFHGNNPRTTYISLAGDYRFGGLLGKIPNYILSRFYGGPNDLIVPVSSVHALRYARHLTYQSKGGNHQARHTSQTGSPDIYSIITPFLNVPGSSSPAIQSPSNVFSRDLAPSIGQTGQTENAGDDQTTDPVTSTGTIADTIVQGQTRTSTLYVDGPQPMAFMLYYGTGDLHLTLTSPSGLHIDPTTAAADPGVDFESLVEEEGLHVQVYNIDTPEVGAWTLEVSASAVVNPSGQEPYFLTGLLTDTAIQLEATTDRSVYHRGDPVIIHASFHAGTAPVSGARVIAKLVSPDQSFASLTLSDDGAGDDQTAGDGIYSGRFSATTSAGLYQLVVSGTGPAEEPFTREVLLLVPVSASTSRLNGTFSDAGNDTDSDGLFDQLVIEVGMDVTLPASYRMLGELADTNGTVIATATAVADLNAGAETISLRFDGASIYKHRMDGPYLLHVVRVAEDDGSEILPLDERLNAYTTASYDHRHFQHPALAALDQTVTTEEDTPVELTLEAESLDPGALSFSVVTPPSHGRLDGTAPHLTYIPEPDFNGADVFTFNVSKETDDSESATVVVTVNPVNDPPVLAPIADPVLDEGTTATVAVSASDLDGDDLRLTIQGLPAFATLTDHGDGTSAIVFAPGFDAAGTYHPTVTVSDGGSSATTTFTLTVNNVNRPPVARAGGPYAANEGDRIILDASGSTEPDADGAIASYEWDLDNDGAHDAMGVTIATVFGDQGSYVVGLRVTDDQGAQATTTAQVTVQNVPPTVGAISAPSGPSTVNSTVTVSAIFADPGVRDTHTAVWDWNDGTTSAGSVLETGSTKLVSGIHAYTAAGVYTLKLTLTDKDGGASTVVHQYIVIYDPDGSFVTGGGWLDSPAGAYPADPALTGRMNFGFVSKYKAGTTVPTGQTQLQFQVANLTFHSDVYQWLVVSGARAQYKGVGEIDGKGEYGFLITAIDGQVNGADGIDKLRVKIWDTASGRVVFDNQIGAPDDAIPSSSIQGGSIVIHSR